MVLSAKAAEVEEGLVDGVDFHIGSEPGQGLHDAAGHVAVKGVVGRVKHDVMLLDQLADLKDGHAHGHAQGLDLVGAGHNAAVVVAHDDNGAILQVRIKNPLEIEKKSRVHSKRT